MGIEPVRINCNYKKKVSKCILNNIKHKKTKWLRGRTKIRTQREKEKEAESLKILDGQSEDVSQRRTDSTMAKMKKNKRTNNDLQNITQKIEDRATRTP